MSKTINKVANAYENVESSLIPYSPNEIETTIKQIMLSKGITDAQYPGSNVSQLGSVISYVIGTLNINTAINLQETILPLATKRMNVLMGARQLGYEPHAIRSYKYEIELEPVMDPSVPETDQTKRTVGIYDGTKFTSGNMSYYYFGDPITVEYSNYDLKYASHANAAQMKPIPMTVDDLTLKIKVVEGDRITSQEDENLKFVATEILNDGKPEVKQDYIIPYHDVEDEYGIRCKLTYIDGHKMINDEIWTKSSKFLIDDSIDSNKRKFIRLENIILSYPSIFFKFGGTGQGIPNGCVIDVEVLQSHGAAGEAKSEFQIDDVTAQDQFIVTDQVEITKGKTLETNEEIKENAIVLKTTGNRAVTRNDYVAILKRDTIVKEADAWGGEEEVPKALGEVFFSCTPKDQTTPFNQSANLFEVDIGLPVVHTKDELKALKKAGNIQRDFNNWYFTKDQQQKLKDYLEPYRIITLENSYRHPLYIDFSYDLKVIKYDLTENPMNTHYAVFEALKGFFKKRIEHFKGEYLSSNVQRLLDTVLDYKTGIDVSVSTQGVICAQMMDEYYKSKGEYKIIVNLGYPFENVIPNGAGADVDTKVLPRIDTAGFGVSGQTLKVDYTKLTGQIGRIRKTDITLDGVKTGEYIVDTKRSVITLVFDFGKGSAATTALEKVFGIGNVHMTNPTFGEYAKFDLSYPPFDTDRVNFTLDRNTIGRLKSVNFKK